MTVITFNLNFGLRTNFGFLFRDSGLVEMFMTVSSLGTVHCLDKNMQDVTQLGCFLRRVQTACYYCGGRHKLNPYHCAKLHSPSGII
jgi:hypothetical protein